MWTRYGTLKTWANEGWVLRCRKDRLASRSSARPDCVAGHVRLELRNVGNNYPFDKSRRFPEILTNSSHRDYSLLSCGGGETQLGPSAGLSQPGFRVRSGEVERRLRDRPS